MRAKTNNNPPPLVSVIIPVFNAATFIERTIQSVLAQTYQFYEILVIDDGSCDGTSDIVKQLAIKDHRIRLLQQQNQGVAAARNFGIRLAHGDYIAPLDADDLWLPEKLSKQVAVMQASPPTVGLVYAWSAPFSDDGYPLNLPQGWELEGAAFLPLFLGNFLSNGSTPLIRRECFDHIGMYNLKFFELDAQGCEDWDIYLRIAEHYEFRVVPEHLVGYWQNDESLSSDWKRMDRSYHLLIEWLRKQHPEIPAFVYRWSRSNYLLYLANKTVSAHQTVDSIILLLQSAMLDPFMLTNRRLQRLFAKNLIPLSWRSTICSPTRSMQKIQLDKIQIKQQHQGSRKPAAGAAWKRRMKLRTERLVKLQHELGLDVMKHQN